MPCTHCKQRWFTTQHSKSTHYFTTMHNKQETLKKDKYEYTNICGREYKKITLYHNIHIMKQQHKFYSTSDKSDNIQQR